MYVAARHRGAPAPREAEFRAYHLLTMLGRHGKYGYSPAVYLAAVQAGAGPLQAAVVRSLEGAFEGSRVEASQRPERATSCPCWAALASMAAAACLEGVQASAVPSGCARVRREGRCQGGTLTRMGC